MRQTVALGALALFCLGLTQAASGQSGPPAAAKAQAKSALPEPKDPDERDFRKVCGNCHAVTMFNSTPRSRMEWMETLEVMFERGAVGTEEQIDGVVRYLDANLTKINMNVADADEIGSVLDVPDTVSAAIVRRRAQLGGKFKTIDEIAAVPGVDKARLEFRKSRLVF